MIRNWFSFWRTHRVHLQCFVKDDVAQSLVFTVMFLLLLFVFSSFLFLFYCVVHFLGFMIFYCPYSIFSLNLLCGLVLACCSHRVGLPMAQLPVESKQRPTYLFKVPWKVLFELHYYKLISVFLCYCCLHFYSGNGRW